MMPFLEFAVDVRASGERAWRELTRRGVGQTALFDLVLETDLVPEAPLCYRTRGGRALVGGRVVEVTPPARFAHTFQCLDLKDAATLVTWEILEIRGGVRIDVTHTLFEEESRSFRRMARVWPVVLRNLQAVLETGRLPLASRLRSGLYRLALPALAARGR